MYCHEYTFLCKKLQEGMPDCGRQFLNYLPGPIDSTFFLRPIDEEELIIEIKRLNPRKACGPYNIGAKVIQLCPRIFANNLTRIFNNSIENANIHQN